eukprot:352033-Chlamydomonas_euryale.AAC.5
MATPHMCAFNFRRPCPVGTVEPPTSPSSSLPPTHTRRKPPFLCALHPLGDIARAGLPTCGASAHTCARPTCWGMSPALQRPPHWPRRLGHRRRCSAARLGGSRSGCRARSGRGCRSRCRRHPRAAAPHACGP